MHVREHVHARALPKVLGGELKAGERHNYLGNGAHSRVGNDIRAFGGKWGGAHVATAPRSDVSR